MSLSNFLAPPGLRPSCDTRSKASPFAFRSFSCSDGLQPAIFVIYLRLATSAASPVIPSRVVRDPSRPG